MLNPVVNRDTKLLNNLQKVLNTLIQDCIRMTDWQKPDEVLKHKEILKDRIHRCSEQFFQKTTGDSGNSYLAVKVEASAQATAAAVAAVGGFNQQQYQQSQQQSGSQSAQSTQSYDQKINEVNGYVLEKQKFVIGEDCGLFGEVENEPNSSQSYQRNFEQSQLTSRLNRPKNNKRKHLSRDSQSGDEYNPESDNSEEEFTQVPQRRRRGRRPNNPDHKYQYNDGRKNCFNESGQARGNGNFPASEKKRVLDFFNAHYDPLKRNKIDLCQKITDSLNYPYASVYYLVSNQKQFFEQCAQSQQADPNVSSYQGQQQTQSLNASMISNNSSKQRYLNKGCYSKPGRPKKIQQDSPGRPNYKENNFLQSDEQLFQQENSMPVSSGPRPRGRPPRAKQDHQTYPSEAAYYDYNDGNEYDKNEDAPIEYSDELYQ